MSSEVDEKLVALNDLQRRALILVAKDYRYQEVAKELKLEAAPMYELIKGLMGHFDLPSSKWEESYTQLGHLGRANHLHTLNVRAESAPANEQPVHQHQEEPPAQISSPEVVVKSGASLGEKILGLKQRLQETIAALCSHPEGHGMGSVVADALGLSRNGYELRLAVIYEELGLKSIEPASDRRNLLREAWAKLQEEGKVPKTPTPVPQVVKTETEPSREPRVPLPVLPDTPKADSPPLRALTATPRAEPPLLSESKPMAPPQIGGYGSGVVIPLPPTVENIDVVSGLFNGGQPSPDMADAVRKRKAAGLKPAYLVLSPSAVDPAMSLAQVVFLDKK